MPALQTPGRIQELLSRLPQSLPAPFDPLDLFFDCLPTHFKELWAQGYFKTQPKDPPSRLSNLFLLMPTASPTVIYTITAKEDYAERREEFVFWAEHRSLPCVAKPLYIPDDLSYKPEIIRWYSAANELETKLFIHRSLLSQLFKSKVLHSGNLLQKVWPELENFSKSGIFRKAISNERAARMHLDSVYDQDKKEELIRLLATAVMLPDKLNHTAWVGYR